ncbi:hypothetical protein TPHA_0L00360 [Tetrapisispora phaffii CBS 4417]|uniref:Mid2 domain-containing protein n=1 Tax=Tetrapisispora phaffii (strain ATCC 24235 / CBS 4417 / NBRC 1672 / NRRL Y-8282 / UCD 70-5) TaxID=1071381 RepID=G8BZR4_TETPH|nr:hypothetical protein TPHA_0L00360 [Tetrapisispora phaffii CBS 4417]CCE65392.1 hypothetical protein TPHA_0L00360 [Tetrapisispora phaffii CBS 4417]
MKFFSQYLIIRLLWSYCFLTTAVSALPPIFQKRFDNSTLISTKISPDQLTYTSEYTNVPNLIGDVLTSALTTSSGMVSSVSQIIIIDTSTGASALTTSNNIVPSYVQVGSNFEPTTAVNTDTAVSAVSQVYTSRPAAKSKVSSVVNTNTIIYASSSSSLPGVSTTDIILKHSSIDPIEVVDPTSTSRTSLTTVAITLSSDTEILASSTSASTSSSVTSISALPTTTTLQFSNHEATTTGSSTPRTDSMFLLTPSDTTSMTSSSISTTSSSTSATSSTTSTTSSGTSILITGTSTTSSSTSITSLSTSITAPSTSTMKSDTSTTSSGTSTLISGASTASVGISTMKSGISMTSSSTISNSFSSSVSNTPLTSNNQKSSHSGITYSSTTSTKTMTDSSSAEKDSTVSKSVISVTTILSSGAYSTGSTSATSISSPDQSKTVIITSDTTKQLTTTKLSSRSTSVTVLVGSYSNSVTDSPEATYSSIMSEEIPNDATAIITKPITDSQASEVYLTRSFDWLPSEIAIQSDSTAESMEPSFLIDTSGLPNIITAPTAITIPSNTTLITVAFKRELNYAFLVNNFYSSAQIFNFLPIIIKHPFTALVSESCNDDSVCSPLFTEYILNSYASSAASSMSTSSVNNVDFQSGGKHSVNINLSLHSTIVQTAISPTGFQTNMTSQIPSLAKKDLSKNASLQKQEISMDITVARIIPYIVQNNKYIISIAEVYVPNEIVETLQELILNPASSFYNSESSSLKTLAFLIDPNIPLTGMLDSNGNLISGGLSSSNGNIQNSSTKHSHGSGISDISSQTLKLGTLDSSAYKGLSTNLKKRLSIFIVCFTVGAVLYIQLSLFGLNFMYKKLSMKADPESDKSSLPQYHITRDSTSNIEGRSSKSFSTPSNPFSDKYQKSSSDSSKSITLPGKAVYNRSQDMTYLVDEQGNFYYTNLDNVQGRTVHIMRTPEGSIYSKDVSYNKYVYDSNNSTSNTYLDDQYHENTVNKGDDLEITYPDFLLNEVKESHTNIIENVKRFNNNGLYKMILPLGTSGTDSETHKGSAQDNLKRHFDNYQGDTNSWNQYDAVDDNSSFNFDDHTYLNNATSSVACQGNTNITYDQSSVSDIEDDEVNDVHVGELDELDEEIYKRITRNLSRNEFINNRRNIKKILTNKS